MHCLSFFYDFVDYKCVALFARYKLPILREICICISNLNIYMRGFKKKEKRNIITVGFETNLEVNAERKRAKYQSLMETLKSKYTDVKFVNLSISSLGIFGLSCSSFIEMCDALAVDMGHRRYLISKLSNTIIRTTYYIFYRRNKPWNSPELLSI